MKIVIFGGSGFLGSHVADQLTDQGHDITIFDKSESPYCGPRQKMVVGDILSFDEVNDVVRGSDIVYNFAGQADITRAMEQPLKTIETNVIGNCNILESCKKNNVQRYIFASTIYVYSKDGSFYRASKQACELFIESYHKQFDLNFTVLRYGSLYGPRADENNWIYRVIKQALREKKIIRKGDGEEVREYIHVTDAARLTASMTKEEFANEYVMITGQQTIRIKDVLVMIKEMLNNEISIEYVPASNEGHYEVTPYTFQPQFARKLTDNSYVDLGQGILELMSQEFDRQSNKKLSSIERV